MSDIGLWFYFLAMSLFAFGIMIMRTSENELGSISSACISWKRLKRTGISSFLNIW